MSEDKVIPVGNLLILESLGTSKHPPPRPNIAILFGLMLSASKE